LVGVGGWGGGGFCVIAKATMIHMKI
jgi:hypothetical protein